MASNTTRLTVGELARLAGVTVRTLHHYDDIGLLPASGRTSSGYRTYDDVDVDRLRAIITYRELGLGLDEIARAVGSDGALETLRMARARVDRRIVRLQSISRALDTAITNETKGTHMTPEDKLSVFGDFDPANHEDEAEERWGGTDAYAESKKRTDTYTKADWEAIRAEVEDIYSRFVSLIESGIEPDSAAAREVVDAHRQHITDRFYDCSPEIHAGLGQMYVGDPRLMENIDRAGDGLAAYMSEAIAATYR
jgi:DNA-binding transcriptional MerR regulator